MKTDRWPRLLLQTLLAIGLPIAMPRAQAISMLDDTATQVAAGGFHTCALTATGAVKCWGGNFSGQLGDATTTSRNVPVETTGLGADTVSIVVGINYSCALTAAGAVKCWGGNGTGQLGDGTTSSRPVPADVVDLDAGVAAIAAGWSHACALTAAGAVKCWGNNNSGQLGDGTDESTGLPVDVAGLASDVTAIATGGAHSCALTTAGAVKCWGSNDYGQLGDGSNTQQLVPTDVLGLTSPVVAIAASGDHTCAVTAAGAMACWGLNENGELGDGSVLPRSSPVEVSGLGSGVAAIALGDGHTCALTTTGSLKCWGRNGNGQTGHPSAEHHVPADVPGMVSDVAAIAAGFQHSCALRREGSVECWGSNTDSQLGRGTTGESTPIATDVTGFSRGVLSFDSGYYHNCALTKTGAPKCWGYNNLGQLGNGSTGYGPNPTPITPANLAGLAGNIAAFAGGGYHTCAKTTTGGVKCWGGNASGALGDGSTTSSTAPVDVVGLASGVAMLSAGSQYNCAVTSGGAAKCWGWNGRSQLGDGGVTDQPSPITVSGLGSGIAAIAAGDSHTCAVTNSGGVKCWGYGYFGQLGNGGGNSSVPVNVNGLSGAATAVAIGIDHTCARLANGSVKCWGLGDRGQLGNGATSNSASPVDVGGLGGAQAIASGAYHVCALTAAGAVKCWGLNDHGQLGDSTTTNRATPVEVGLGERAIAIDAGYLHTCALLASGGMTCWGINGSGTLGNGATADNRTPASVRADQSITFAPAATITVGSVVELAASASSGGAIGFDSWTPSICTIDGTTLTTLRTGVCGLRASRPGFTDANGNGYAPAPQQLRLIPVIPGSQNIGNFAATPADPTYSPNATFEVGADGGASGNPVAFSIDAASASICSISGRTAAILAAGTCRVLADQVGNADYAAAPQAQLDVVIAKAPQRLTFATAPTLAVGGTATIAASSAEPNSGQPIAYSAAPPSICTIDGAILRGVGAGDCTVTAQQAGDGNYLDGSEMSTITVARGSQSIAFPPQQPDHRTFAPDGTFGVEPLASGGASDNAVTYSSLSPAVCTIADTTVTILAAGACVLAADQAGNADYEPAAQTSQMVTIDKAPQTLSFGPAPAIVAGHSGTVSASSAEPNSGQPLAFSVAPAAVCTIEGTTVSGVSAGDCVVTVRQGGDENYLDGNATQTIAIARAPQASLSVRVSDERDYARYGMLLNYLVTVSNSGDADATGLHIGGEWPAQLDPAATHWACFGGGGGTTCADGGNGAFDDTGVVIPAGRSLSWLVTAPVRLDAEGGAIDYTVGIAGDEARATDSDVLVVLRSGFDVPYGDGAEGSRQPPALACAAPNESRTSVATTQVVVVPAPAATTIDTLLRADGKAPAGFRVERLNAAASPRVRLVAIDAAGNERASAWASAAVGARIAIGAAVGDDGHGALLLEGTRPPLQLPLPDGLGADLRLHRCD